MTQGPGTSRPSLIELGREGLGGDRPRVLRVLRSERVLQEEDSNRVDTRYGTPGMVSCGRGKDSRCLFFYTCLLRNTH